MYCVPTDLGGVGCRLQRVYVVDQYITNTAFYIDLCAIKLIQVLCSVISGGGCGEANRPARWPPVAARWRACAPRPARAPHAGRAPPTAARAPAPSTPLRALLPSLESFVSRRVNLPAGLRITRPGSFPSRPLAAPLRSHHLVKTPRQNHDREHRNPRGSCA